MLLHLKDVLTPEELRHARQVLEAAAWTDGRATAGAQALAVKNNQQLPQDSQASRELQAMVRAALNRHAIFFSAALPKKIFGPLFNRYGGETNHYGNHVDGAVLHSRLTGERVRSDVSCTLFLSEPDEYEGGELVVEDSYGSRRVKLPAGHALLYPATSVHRVEPVTRGCRMASFFWVESMVRGAEQRRLLFDLDMNLLRLRQRLGETPETVALTGVYHNLLRQWATP